MRLGSGLSPTRALIRPKSALQRILALSPSLLVWPAQSAGWQGTSGGTLAASGQPLGLGVDLSQLQGKTLAEWLASAAQVPGSVTPATLGGGLPTAISGGWIIRRNSDSSISQYLSLPTVEIGKTYVIEATIANDAGEVGNTVQLRDGGTPFGLQYTAGTLRGVRKAASTALAIWPLGPSHSSEVTNITIRELPGNHLIAGTWASPSDAARGTFQNNAISFGGVDDYYSLLNAISITEQMTVVRAFKRASAGIKSAGIGTSATVPYDPLWFTDDRIYQALTSGAAFNTTPNTTTGSLVTTSRRSASTEILRLNGTQLLTRSAAAVGGILDFVGRRNADYNSGEISFLAVFPSELTGADLALVEQIAASTNGAVLA